MNEGAPALRIRMEAGSEVAADLDLTFTSAFRIGRDPGCEVHVPSPLVSRYHAELWPEGAGWWIQDLESTNGVLLNGEPVVRAGLNDGDVVQLGAGAPALRVSAPGLAAAGAPSSPEEESQPVGIGDPRQSTVRVGEAPPTVSEGSYGRESGEPPQDLDRGPTKGTDGELSLAEIAKKYFDPRSDRPAGKRTEFIRLAYAQIQKKEKKKTRLIIGGVGVLLLAALGYGIVQRLEVRRIDRLASELFQTMKAYEVQLVTIRQQAEELGSPELLNRLASIDSLRMRALASYEGFVRERGLYRRLRSREEQLVFQTARVFGESEFTISGEFVAAVLDEVQNHWLSPSGRVTYRQAIEGAERNGYTGEIVRILRSQGVAPEFFFLALQESGFKVDAVGPPTRWGRAKGMWQFIPSTASRYGLDPGPLQDTGARDPDDERQDFNLSTAAAARYLRDLHGYLTQASGLLVMAAYNWGEHRVAPRLENLPEPRDVFEAEFAEVPENPASRNYWTFLTEHRDRMPEQTKTYVLRIFSAAVIGQDPEHFGFDFPNPLLPYVD